MARHRLRATRSARTAAENLRGPPKTNWERIKDELRAIGCRAGGYRLLNRDGGWSPYCCRPIYANWRAVTTYARCEVIVVAIGEHDGASLYAELAKELGTSAIGVRREDKPACCSKDGWPTLGTKRRS